MPKEFSGEPKVSQSARFAIIVSKYNLNITENLKQGAVQALLQAGVDDQQMEIFWVPGAWEISFLADRLARRKVYSAIICLGAVIRGETTHDQHINRQVSLSLGQIAMQHQVPIQFGLLTCNSLEQAIHRSGGNVGNKGEECAQAALEIVSLLERFPFD